jgi:hypothetical protein
MLKLVHKDPKMDELIHTGREVQITSIILFSFEYRDSVYNE